MYCTNINRCFIALFPFSFRLFSSISSIFLLIYKSKYRNEKKKVYFLFLWCSYSILFTCIIEVFVLTSVVCCDYQSQLTCLVRPSHLFPSCLRRYSYTQFQTLSYSDAPNSASTENKQNRKQQKSTEKNLIVSWTFSQYDSQPQFFCRERKKN